MYLHIYSFYLLLLQEIDNAQKFLEHFKDVEGSEGMSAAVKQLTEARFNAVNLHKRGSILHIESVMVVGLTMTDKTSKLKVLSKQKEKLLGVGEDDLKEDHVQPLLMQEVNKTLG